MRVVCFVEILMEIPRKSCGDPVEFLGRFVYLMSKTESVQKSSWSFGAGNAEDKPNNRNQQISRQFDGLATVFVASQAKEEQ